MAYRNNKNGTKDKKGYRDFYTYTEGNIVRKLNVAEELQKPYEPVEISHTTRKNRDKALYMNLGYVLFLIHRSSERPPRNGSESLSVYF